MIYSKQQQKTMSRYPITPQTFEKEVWTRKINATLMLSFQAEEETLPHLEQFVELLGRINTLPLAETLEGDGVILFFFDECFPAICQKLINSKYFKNEAVLVLSNKILELSASIYLKYLEFTPGFLKFAELLTIIFEPDMHYFKQNNPLDFKAYPWLYYKHTQENEFLKDLKVGDLIDAIKYEISTKKATWSRATISEMNEDFISVKFLNDLRSAQKDIVVDSVEIAPAGTMAKDFDWRMDLKEGDQVDCCDNYGSWYSGTVIKAKKRENGKVVRVGFKIFDPNGDKSERGHPYFGLSDSYDSDDIDVTSPEIQPLRTVARFREYGFTKNHSDFVNDANDHVMEYVAGQRIYVVPRLKFGSETLFKIVNNFIRQGGFDKMLAMLEAKINPDLLAHFITPIGEISPMLHKLYIKELLERIKPIVAKHFVDESEPTIKSFTKDKSETIFGAMKSLLKRVESTEQSKQYEVSTKLELANLCLKSESLKRRLQGLSEVKDILKSVRSHLTQKVNLIGKWLRDHHVFEKIYVQNSHAQLIKKSSEYFKFLVTENLLQVNELQLIYKAAQRGDFEARVAVYKLFEEVSHHFKKHHVDYLIDQILDSEINLVATEDMDLLNELSKFSTYFPLQKVVTFLEKILFGENSNPNSQLMDITIKRYSEIVVRNTDMIKQRQQNIQMLAEKLKGDKVEVTCRVLTSILENVGSGEYGRYEILEYINKAKLDSIVLDVLRRSKEKDSSRYLIIMEKLLHMLALAVQNSPRIKLNIDNFIKFWEEFVKNGKNPKEKEIYYKWCSSVTKVENVFSEDNDNKLEDFFLKLVSPEEMATLNESSFQAISIMFISINMKCHNIVQSSTWKNGKEDKLLKLLVPLSHLKFYDQLLTLIYNVQDIKVSEIALELYCFLYGNYELTSQEREKYLARACQDFFAFYSEKEYSKIPKVLKILNLIIDESEKGGPVQLKSLAMFKKGEQLTIDVLNENAYMSDTNKSFQIKIDSNNTLFDLRKAIAKHISATWQELKLNQKEEIPDYYNGRLIKDCGIRYSESIKVNKRHIVHPQQQLLFGHKLSPKAAKAFEGIFKRFSTDGKMSKDECQKFIVVCLGEATTRTYDERISGLYEKYDDDKDNLLTLDNFLLFYEDAAKERPNTVWGNLKNCRIRYDLKSMDDPDSDLLQLVALPRFTLSQNKAFYEALFDLLMLDESIAKPSWKMLEKMPVSAGLYGELLTEPNYEILDIQNPYKTLYCLYILQNLLENDQVEAREVEWKERFVREEGYEKLFKMYTKIFEHSGSMKQVEIQISQFILDLISEFIVTVFKTPDSIKSHQILKSNIDFDELVAYISTKAVPTDKNKLTKFNSILSAEENYSKFKDHEWKGVSEREMTDYIIESIKKLWKQKDNGKVRDRMLEDCLSILLTLMLHHQDCSKFLPLVPDLISTAPSHHLLVKLYLLLVCFCFYGKVDQQPVINTLLNFLKISEEAKSPETAISNSNEKTGSAKKEERKSAFISEEYFRTLVVLIEYFGLTDMSPETISILLRNVLENANEQIIQASALVLSRLRLSTVSVDILKEIWAKCLFSSSISCKKPQTREAVYRLILSIGSYDQSFVNELTEIVTATLLPCVDQLKSMSQLELKSRCLFNYAGLRNLGAVCYMLAMLQQFYMNPTFRYLMLRVNDEKQPNLQVHNNRQYDDNLLHQFQRLFAFLEKTERGDYNPVDFCYSFKDFDGNPVNVCVQQDTQEFVFMLLDRLENALSSTPFKHVISNMYKGKLANLFTCSKCNNTKVREEDYFCLTLEVKNSKTLAESFSKFTNGEVINDYTCDLCSQKADVSKKTLVSKLPRVLIVHLQRIVFSLDTFVNEKISTKLEFPFEIDLTPYKYEPVEKKSSKEGEEKEEKQEKEEKKDVSLNEITTTKNQDSEEQESKEASVKNEPQSDKKETKQTNEAEPKNEQNQDQKQNQNKNPKNSNMYDLVGVVAHNGGAEYGHYYSYIKTESGQWLDFNDSNVKLFDLKNLQNQWFGGTTEAIDEEFDWTVKKENSRSAYLLIYQQREEVPIQLTFTDEKEKEGMLEKLKLMELKEAEKIELEEDLTKLLDDEELPVSVRKFSKEEIVKDEEKKEIPQKLLNVFEPIEPYISDYYLKKILEDNLLHQFEINICSSQFIKFFTRFLQLDIPKEKLTEIIQLTLKLALGIWLKQPALKELLPALEKAVKRDPSAGEIIISNETVVNMLLESSDNEIRNCMESLLTTSVNQLIETNNLTLTKSSELDTKLVNFLDHLFSLIPTTVSKNWMKFSQYFSFWKSLSLKGDVQTSYMLSREMISHLLDYFLDKKSPLGIYAKKKHEIGNKSSSINPNFTSLLDTVSNLVGLAMNSSPMRLTPSDNKILMSFDFLDKIFSESSPFGANLVRSMCTGNIAASERVAIVLTKAFLKCTFDNIQPFLDVAQSYLLIKDDYQEYRMRWVLGSPRLLISTLDKSIMCLNTYSLDQRLYNYDSTLQFEQTQSMLEGLFKNMTRMLNYCMLTLRSILTVCVQDEDVKKYVWKLPPPLITYGHYVDFFEQFIDSYIKEGIKLAYSSYPKVEIGNSALELYNKIINKEKGGEKGKPEKEEEIIEEIQPEKQKSESYNSVKGLDNNSDNKDDWEEEEYQHEEQGNEIHPHLYYGGSAAEYGIENYDAFDMYRNNDNDNDNGDGFDTYYRNALIDNADEEVKVEDIDLCDTLEQQDSHNNENVEGQFGKDSERKQVKESNGEKQKENVQQEQSNTDKQKEPAEQLQKIPLDSPSSSDQNTSQPPEDPNACYHPVQLQYRQESLQTIKGLNIHHHCSTLVFIRTFPTLKRNDIFLNTNKKLIDRIPRESYDTAIRKVYKGVYLQNKSKETLRYQWKYGLGFIKPNESVFSEAQEITKVWSYEKEDWAKTSMF